LVLGAIVVWLLIERGRLTEEAKAAQAKLEENGKELEQLRVRAQANRTVQPPGTMLRPGSLLPPEGTQGAAKGNWLDDRIDKGSKALDPKKPGLR
jgi:hypothetical protein